MMHKEKKEGIQDKIKPCEKKGLMYMKRAGNKSKYIKYH